jgi:hypothetical protein
VDKEFVKSEVKVYAVPREVIITNPVNQPVPLIPFI